MARILRASVGDASSEDHKSNALILPLLLSLMDIYRYTHPLSLLTDS